MTDTRPHVAILGIRGIPAAHGGFETFAQRLALHLLAGEWRVTVYCQDESAGAQQQRSGALFEDEWQGVRRVRVPSGPDSSRASILFDWRCIGHVVEERPDVVLTLGYNTAIFCAKLRVAGIPNVINMDGLEWQREKWSWPARAFLYFNERAGCLLGNRLIADHPAIARHLATRVSPHKISMIPYGADVVEEVSDAPVRALGLTPGRYATVIARPEKENSLLEIVQGFSAAPRNVTLAVLGNYQPDVVLYHRAVMDAASPEVKFLGAIYEPEVVAALRAHGVLYVHGHRVGGTNPSLVEALGAGNPVLAHRNRFNYWVCGSAAEYFDDAASCATVFDELLSDPYRLREMAYGSRHRHRLEFRWERVLQRYEQLLFRMIQRQDVKQPSRYAEVTSGLRMRDFEAQGSGFMPHNVSHTVPGSF